MNDELQEILQQIQQQIQKKTGNWDLLVDLAKQAIAHLDDDDGPKLRADLHNTLATSLGEANEVWPEELVQQVFQAYETALQLFAEADAAWEWVQTLRNIGATYFRAALSTPGNAPLRLDRAIQAYQQALLFDPLALDPQIRATWRQELGSIREVAIETWESLLPRLDGEAHAQERAQAHLALGGLYHLRSVGDSGENLERAIASLDRALEVLSFEATPDAWLEAHRHRGQAYLSRREGGKKENLERALESLQISVRHLSREVDPQAWSKVMTQIGKIQLCRHEIGAAVASLEQALTVEQALWNPETWADTQLLLAGMRLGLMVDETTEIGARPDTWDHDGTGDPFDQFGKLQEQAAEMARNVDVRAMIEDRVFVRKEGSAPIAIDPEWHVPPMASEAAALLRRHFEKGFQSASLWRRNADDRQALERARLEAYTMMLSDVIGRHQAAARTQALFERVARAEEAFALMLRDFGLRAHRFESASLTWGPLGESFGIRNVAERVAPLPLVWITNPADPGRLDANEGFRVESAAEWQSDVRKLIAAASFIVMDNGQMTEGVRYEITALRELGRLDDTLFADTATAAEFLGSPVRGMTDEELAPLRGRARPRQIDEKLPAAACHWVGGAQREAFEAKLRSLQPWLQALPAPLSAAAADLTLDALAYVISAAAVLEKRELLPPLLARAAQALETYSDDDLREAQQLAHLYAKAAEQLRGELVPSS